MADQLETDGIQTSPANIRDLPHVIPVTGDATTFPKAAGSS